MKNFLLILFCLSASMMWAQEESTADTTKIKIGDLKVILVDDESEDNDTISMTNEDDDDDNGRSSKEELTHWGGIDLGVNILMDADGNTDMTAENAWLDQNYARSLSWNFNIIETKIRLAKDYVGIITGLGLSYNSYGLADSVTVMNKFPKMVFDDQGELISSTVIDSTWGAYDSSFEFTKNKLRTSQLRVPVMLEFNTSQDNDRSFHLAAGVIGGWRFSTITKQHFSQDGKEHKYRQKGDFNTNDFSLDASVRVGYRNFTLYGTYALTPLFEEGKGPEVYPVSVGLSVVPW